MPRLSRNQGRYLAALVNNMPGLDPRLAKGWLIGENPAGANSTPQHGNQNWLNIGNTDSKFYAQGGAYSNPGQAGKNTARWLKGEWSMPGFGRAAPGIVNFANVAKGGGSLQDQIKALQGSGWASSGYPDLPSIVSGAGPAGFMKYAKDQQAVTKAAQRQMSAKVPPTSPVKVNTPSTSDLFSSLARLSSQDVYNPYAAQSQNNYEFFADLAKQNEATNKTLQQQANAALKSARSHIKDVNPRDPAQTGVTGRGPQAALQFADNRLGKGIHETGTNSGPYISDWIRSFGLSPGAASPWCGVFVGKGLQAAGIDVDPSVVGVANIRRMAQEGRGGFERLVSFKELQPGDVFMRGDDHTGFVRSINRKTGMITTVEGNASDAVSSNQLASSGLDFARPAYGKGRRH